MSDEGDVADDAASDGTVVTKAAARPQRPTGKRTRQRALDAEDDESPADDATSEADDSTSEVKKDLKKDSAKKDKKPTSKSAKSATQDKTKKSGKKSGKKAGSSSSVNPIMFVFNYLKQVVAEMRKVIWPNRKQMVTYTSVVLVFLAFMVALVGGTDLGLSKLVLLVFG